MADLTADRATDARVADAMGWTRVEHWRQNDVVRGNVPGRPWDTSPLIVPRYTTDAACVVPMLERIAELTDGGWIRLMRHMDGGWSLTVADQTCPPQFQGAAANLACAAALLWLAGREKGDVTP